MTKTGNRKRLLVKGFSENIHNYIYNAYFIKVGTVALQRVPNCTKQCFVALIFDFN